MNLFLISIFSIFFSISAHAQSTTNCEETGIDKILPADYKGSSAALCQRGFRGSYILAAMLRAITQGKARFIGGSPDLYTISGFTAIAAAGYQLDSSLVHRQDGKLFVTLRFIAPEVTSISMNQLVTYQIFSPDFGIEPIERKLRR
jgi:hypothetical protein